MNYEDILVNLKVLEKIQIDEKLISRDQYLNIEYSSVIPVGVRRWWRQDNRNEMIKKIRLIIHSAIQILKENKPKQSIVILEDSMTENKKETLNLYLKNSIIGIQNLNDKPILGSGVGSYKNSVQHFLEQNTINVKHDLAISNNPHNEFVSMSTQLGLFGLSLYILFLYSLFKEARKRYLAIGAFVIIFVSSFFNSVFYDNVFGLFIVIMLSLVYQKNYLE